MLSSVSLDKDSSSSVSSLSQHRKPWILEYWTFLGIQAIQTLKDVYKHFTSRRLKHTNMVLMRYLRVRHDSPPRAGISEAMILHLSRCLDRFLQRIRAWKCNLASSKNRCEIKRSNFPQVLEAYNLNHRPLIQNVF